MYINLPVQFLKIKRPSSLYNSISFYSIIVASLLCKHSQAHNSLHHYNSLCLYQTFILNISDFSIEQYWFLQCFIIIVSSSEMFLFCLDKSNASFNTFFLIEGWKSFIPNYINVQFFLLPILLNQFMISCFSTDLCIFLCFKNIYSHLFAYFPQFL